MPQEAEGENTKMHVLEKKIVMIGFCALVCEVLSLWLLQAYELNHNVVVCFLSFELWLCAFLLTFWAIEKARKQV